MKSMILLTLIIQPWPPQDFGQFVDSQTFSVKHGVQKDTFSMYFNAIFNKDLLSNYSLPSGTLQHNTHYSA
jgi:hypothetical protein